jgi:hypothetical protein
MQLRHGRRHLDAEELVVIMDEDTKHLVHWVTRQLFHTMVMYHEGKAVEQGVSPRTAHKVAVEMVGELFTHPKYKRFYADLKKLAEFEAKNIEDEYMRHQTILDPLDRIIEKHKLSWMFWEQEDEA